MDINGVSVFEEIEKLACACRDCQIWNPGWAGGRRKSCLSKLFPDEIQNP